MQKPQCPVKISTYLDWILAWELFETRVGWINYVEVGSFETLDNWYVFHISCLLVVSQIPTFLSLPNRWVRLSPRWKNVCYLRFGTLVAGGFQQLKRSWWKPNRCCFPRNARWWGCKTSTKISFPTASPPRFTQPSGYGKRDSGLVLWVLWMFVERFL